MQVNRMPPWWAVVFAHVLGYGLTLILALLVYLFLGKFLFPGPGEAAWPGWIRNAFVLLLAGVLLAALQRSTLRKWMPQRRLWLAIGGLLPVLILGVWGLLSALAALPPPPPNPNWWRDYATWTAAGERIGQVSLLAGLAAGFPAGLLFGMAQSFLLPGRKRLWWVASALAWAIVIALLLALRNVALVMLG